MLTKRIIPCLDVKDGRVVKGVKFLQLRDAADPVEIAKFYDAQGADELVFLDITASHEKRKTFINIVREVAKSIFMPFTVGGGISTISDMEKMLLAGAEKVSVNTAAVKTPKIILQGAKRFGSQCIVTAIDAKACGKNKWEVVTYGGRRPTGIDAVKWAKRVQDLGAGEILLTSMDYDGTKDGYDIALTKAITDKVNIPVIASGGAGSPKHMSEVFKKANADAALAASIFHFKEYGIRETKEYLSKKGIGVRI